MNPITIFDITVIATIVFCFFTFGGYVIWCAVRFLKGLSKGKNNEENG